MDSRNSKSNAVIVVQGAQYGSEAKGAVAAFLCEERIVDFAIRTGTVNAGHTVMWEGKPFKMQQLPTGWVSAGTRLVIGPGAFIHPIILANEIRMVNAAVGYDIRKGMAIDYRCGYHSELHTDRSTQSGRHHSMGATGKGCSEAVIDKIRMRGKHGINLFTDWMAAARLHDPGTLSREAADTMCDIVICDTSKLLNDAWDDGAQLLVEGTQGTMLDLHLGPYPYTTHKQTQVGNWLAEAGLSAALPLEVILVARTYPIRVAGNSGPLPREISWVELATRINKQLEIDNLPPRVQWDSIRAFEEACETASMTFKSESLIAELGLDKPWQIERWSQEWREQHPAYVSELHKIALLMLPKVVVDDLRQVFEMTTVTNKLRRVADLDVEVLRQSVQLNRPTSIALTFMNYVEPAAWDKSWGDMPIDVADGIEDYVKTLNQDLEVEIKYISTGAATELVLPMTGG